MKVKMLKDSIEIGTLNAKVKELEKQFEEIEKRLIKVESGSNIWNSIDF